MAAHGAPIQKYSDPRLYGIALVEPFREVYASWISPLRNPIHPASNKLIEIGRRSCNALVGVVVSIVLSVFAMVGRVAQIIHFHSLSAEARRKPAAIAHKGLRIPALQGEPSEAPDLSFKECQKRIAQQKSAAALPAGVEIADQHGRVMAPAVLPFELEISSEGQTVKAAQTTLRGGAEFSRESPVNQPKESHIIAVIADDVHASEIAWLSLPYSVQANREALFPQWQNKPRDARDANDPRFHPVVGELFRKNGFKAYTCPNANEGSSIVFCDFFAAKIVRVRIGEQRSVWGIPAN